MFEYLVSYYFIFEEKIVKRFVQYCAFMDSSLKRVAIGPETSVRNYHYSLRSNPEEGSSQWWYSPLEHQNIPAKRHSVASKNTEIENQTSRILYRVILSVLDPRKCEYLKYYSLDFEHAYMTTYPAS